MTGRVSGNDGSWGQLFNLIVSVLVFTVSVASIFVPVSAGSAESRQTFKWGFRERVRQSYIRNPFDLDDDKADDRNYLRFRTQMWGSWEPSDGWKVFAQLNNEHRHWLKSEKGLEDEDFEIDELVVENLYISAERIAGSRFSVTLGRQNIMLGEGFIFMDGGPLDGSRTAYFNGLRGRIDGESRSLELHVISDPTWDKYMPVVNNLHRSLIEYEEKGAGLYYIDNSYEGRKIEAYYSYKNEKHPDGKTPESDIHTIGGRFSGVYGEGFSYAAELALQFGERGGKERSGMGGYLTGEYDLPLTWKPSVGGGFIYLSGDDPSTEDYEGWAPLYSRWPKWSDYYIYILAVERGVAYWENIMAPNASVTLNPSAGVSLKGTFYYMLAPQDDPYSVPGGTSANPLFGGGDARGFLSVARLNWKYTEYLSGHLLWEHMAPGDYYSDYADTADFLRLEFFFKY